MRDGDPSGRKVPVSNEPSLSFASVRKRFLLLLLLLLFFLGEKYTKDVVIHLRANSDVWTNQFGASDRMSHSDWSEAVNSVTVECIGSQGVMNLNQKAN